MAAHGKWRWPRSPTMINMLSPLFAKVPISCQLDFAERYGPIGKGFIEAHHLKPLSSLTEGSTLTYDVAKDFAVLCPNCHRMIHRTPDPSDLKGFRELVSVGIL